jgi:hypothetical protein
MGNIILIGDEGIGRTTVAESFIRKQAGTARSIGDDTNNQDFDIEKIAKTLDVTPDLVIDTPCIFSYQSDYFFELGRNICNGIILGLRRTNFIACETCFNSEKIPISGRRWANSLRRKGWRRSGKDWFCPDCTE